jgi:hypothetical protein
MQVVKNMLTSNPNSHGKFDGSFLGISRPISDASDGLFC